MKRLWITAAAIGLFALPAAAQQSPSKSQSMPSAGQSSAAQPSAGLPASAQTIRQNLEKSGFQDVSVIDAAYLVHARTSDGSIAVMFIDPPGGPAPTTGAGGSSPASSQQRLKENLQKSGFSNVVIVDTAYLVTAKDPDGGMVRMMINPSPPKGVGAGGRSPGAQK